MDCSPYPFLRTGERIIGGALDGVEGTLVCGSNQPLQKGEIDAPWVALRAQNPGGSPFRRLHIFVEKTIW